MNQENYNDQEIIDLIGDLERVGHGQTLKISLCFDVNPNEYLYTNIPKFRDAYFERNSFSPGTEISHQVESGGVSTKDKHIFTISGPSSDVRKIQDDMNLFSWINPDSIQLISEEWTR
jgi:hypothetical protein